MTVLWTWGGTLLLWACVVAGSRGWLSRFGLVRCSAGDWGTAFVLGYCLFTIPVFWGGLAGIPIGWPLISGSALLVGASGIWAGRGHWQGKSGSAPKEPWTPAEFVVLTGLAVYGILAASSALFYPILATDAFSYDARAKFMIADGALNLAYFHWPGNTVTSSSNVSYPPLFSLALGATYALGGWQTKIVTFLFYLALPLSVFAALRDRLPRFPALLWALFVPLTPEMFSHASYGLLNTPAAVILFVEASALYRYTQERHLGWLALAGILAAGLTGTRPDGVILHGALVGAAFLTSPELKPRRMVWWAACAAAPLATWGIWTLYARTVIGILPSTPFAGGDILGFKVMAFATPRMLAHIPTFSIIFLVWAATLPFAVWFARKHRGIRFWQLAGILGLAGIFVIYTQISRDYGGGINAVLNSSFKRSLFYLVPICAVAAAFTPPFSWLAGHGNQWFFKKAPKP